MFLVSKSENADLQECFAGIDVIKECVAMIASDPEKFGGKIISVTLFASKMTNDDGDIDPTHYNLYVTFTTEHCISVGDESVGAVVSEGCSHDEILQIHDYCNREYNAGLMFFSSQEVYDFYVY